MDNHHCSARLFVLSTLGSYLKSESNNNNNNNNNNNLYSLHKNMYIKHINI